MDMTNGTIQTLLPLAVVLAINVNYQSIIWLYSCKATLATKFHHQLVNIEVVDTEVVQTYK